MSFPPRPANGEADAARRSGQCRRQRRQTKQGTAARRGGDHPRPGAAGAGLSRRLRPEDDCALLTPAPGTELVLKTDPVAEGVHFLAGDAPEDIAWKALAVNVSDLAAKAARPLGYLMALSFPAAPTRRLAVALRRRPRARRRTRFGCHLIGGDTDRRPGPLTITITVIGEVERGRMVRRGTAQAGDARVRLRHARRCGARACPAQGPGAGCGLGPVARRGRASAPALSPARAAPGAGRRAARSRLAPPWTSPTAWPRTSPACARRAAAPRACASPTCRSPPAAAKALAADPSASSSASSPAATTTRCSRRSLQRRPPASRRQPPRPAFP